MDRLSKKTIKRWKIAFWITLVLFVGVAVASAAKGETIIHLQNQVNQLQAQNTQLIDKYNKLFNEYNSLTSSNTQARQKCINDAESLGVLAPNMYSGNNVQALISGCQSEYPSN